MSNSSLQFALTEMLAESRRWRKVRGGAMRLLFRLCVYVIAVVGVCFSNAVSGLPRLTVCRTKPYFHLSVEPISRLLASVRRRGFRARDSAG